MMKGLLQQMRRDFFQGGKELDHSFGGDLCLKAVIVFAGTDDDRAVKFGDEIPFGWIEDDVPVWAHRCPNRQNLAVDGRDRHDGRGKGDPSHKGSGSQDHLLSENLISP